MLNSVVQATYQSAFMFEMHSALAGKLLLLLCVFAAWKNENLLKLFTLAL